MKTKSTLLIIVASFVFAINSYAQKVQNPDKLIVVSEHYTGGQEAMYKFFTDNLNYPITAKRNRIQGVNIVKFTLKADGTIENLQVVKNIGGGCGEEARRLVSLLKFNPPGYEVNVSIPLNFRIQ